MKKTILILSLIFASTISFGQTDSVKAERNDDTIRIGGMIILKKGQSDEKKQVTVTVGNKKARKAHSNVSTSSLIFDIGLSNWTDKTDYSAAKNNGYLVTKSAPDLGSNDLKLRTIKSVNINIWFFMQRMNLIKHYVNLKYGLGLELNNYRFKNDISSYNAIKPPPLGMKIETRMAMKIRSRPRNCIRAKA